MTSALTREAFSREAMGHLDHLFRVAVHLIKDRQEAQDLVQETYARSLASYDRFMPGSNLKAWLTKILYNLFFDNVQQKKRWVSVEPSSTEEDASDYWGRLPSENPGPESDILRKELSTKVSDVVQKLPEEFRLPIVLVDMGEFSYAEAAEMLSCPIGTIRSRLSRGRSLVYKHLRLYVESEEESRPKK